MIKRILVCISGDSFVPVETKEAVTLALHHGAKLTGVGILDRAALANVGSVPGGAAQAARELREHRLEEARKVMERELREFEDECLEAGVEYTVIREPEGDPFEVITKLSRYHDLMVFGLRSIFEHGIVDEPHAALSRLSATGAQPILAVPEQWRPIKRILIAYNGSIESARAMKTFVRLNLWPDADITIVTFRAAEEPSQLLEDATSYCRSHGLNVEAIHGAGDAPKNLLAFADERNIDLIVMGNTALKLGFFRRLTQMVTGETTLHVLQNANIPVFLMQ